MIYLADQLVTMRHSGLGLSSIPRLFCLSCRLLQAFKPGAFCVLGETLILWCGPLGLREDMGDCRRSTIDTKYEA